MPANYHSATSQGHTLPGHLIYEQHTFEGSIIDFNIESSSGLVTIAPSICNDGKTLAVSAEAGGSTSQFPPETPWKYYIKVLVDDPVPPDWIARFYSDGDCSGSFVDVVAVGREGGLPDLQYQDNQLSSCIVKKGYKAKAYNDANYTGRKMEFGKDPYQGRANCKYTSEGHMKFTYFPSKMNDSITSIYCELDP